MMTTAVLVFLGINFAVHAARLDHEWSRDRDDRKAVAALCRAFFASVSIACIYAALNRLGVKP